MEAYWSKQTKAKPLFSDMLWDKPETKHQAGKLLVIGGNSHSFAAMGAAYEHIRTAGIGVGKVLIPDALKKTVGSILEHGEFAPSTKSGSFSKQALDTWLDLAQWADGVLLPGDLGRNSETAIVLERFIDKFAGQITITGDALDYFTTDPLKLLDRSNTIIVASFAQLQRMAINARFQRAFVYDLPVAKMVEHLHLLSSIYPASLVMKHRNIFYVAKDGDITTTQVDGDENIWRVESAAKVSVWALQNPTRILEAASCAVLETK